MISKNKAEINFGGENRTFYFGIGFLGILLENTDNTLSTIKDNLAKNPFKYLPELMYYSLLYGYIKQDAKPEFNKFDVIDWIDGDGGVNAATTFLNAFLASFETNLPKDNNVKKKKVKK